MLIFLVGFRICYFIHFDNIRVEGDGWWWSVLQRIFEYIQIFEYFLTNIDLYSICCHFQNMNDIWIFLYEYWQIFGQYFIWKHP